LFNTKRKIEKGDCKASVKNTGFTKLD